MSEGVYAVFSIKTTSEVDGNKNSEIVGIRTASVQESALKTQYASAVSIFSEISISLRKNPSA